MRKKVHKIFVPLICGLAVLTLIGFFAREALRVAKVPKIEKVKEKTKEEIPSAEHFVASGKQVYERITDKPRDPQIIEVEVDPLDVEIGKTQVVTVKVKTKADSVRAEDYVLGTAILDGNKIDFPLKLKKAEGKEELITIWQGEWKREFPIKKHYQIRIFVKNIKGEDEAILSFGSACPGVPLGGDYTVATSCTFAYNVDGVDNGNLTIAGPETCAPSGCQLTINAGQTIVWNPGKSVYVNGSIWINKGTPGGQLKKGYICAVDSDSDGYYSRFDFSSVSSCTSTFGGLSKRRSELTSWPSSFDCNDSDSARWQNRTCYYDGDNDGYRTTASATRCVGSDCTNSTDAYKRESTAPVDCDDSTSTKYQNLTCYTDADGDGYGAGTASTQCCGSACGSGCTGYSATSSDCCDSDSRVNPGAGWYTTGDAGCGKGWDFNCNGTVEKQFPTAYGSTCTCSAGACPSTQANKWSGTTVPACGATGTLCQGYSECSVGADCQVTQTQGCR
jgi:hypothetical protein